MYCLFSEMSDTIINTTCRIFITLPSIRRLWRYQRADHNWQKKKYKRTNNDLQYIAHKTKDRVTRTPLITGVGELGCFGRVSSSCSTSGTRRINLVTNLISHEWGKGREVFTTGGTYLWSFVTKIFRTAFEGITCFSSPDRKSYKMYCPHF